MKKFLLISVLSLVCAVSVTACGSEENSETSSTGRKIYVNEEAVTEPDFETVEMQDIQQLIDNFDNDENFNTDTMYYELFAEKVMVSGNDFQKDGDNIQVVVMCHVEKPEENEEYYKIIAAEKDFYDATVPKGPELESRTIWKFIENSEYYAWSAESIIKSALDYLEISEDDMEMYRHYTIKTLFPE
ncbi:MAG: hypothetical protein K2G36_04175 [Ruminococcus sp.]|nr:hypothetical protein [Ruminococcus sp.]